MFPKDNEVTKPITSRSVLIFGTTPWNIERVIRESTDLGLQAAMVRLSSDVSEAQYSYTPLTSRDDTVRGGPLTIEILPDRPDEACGDIVHGLQARCGSTWCVFPLNDYLTEHAAVMSELLSNPCYPQASARIANQKHRLRELWNETAALNNSSLLGVPYCRVEMSSESSEFRVRSNAAFDALPENTRFVVKPDALSGSIEVSSAASKAEAISSAHKTCHLLESKWADICKTIGAELQPHVLIEAAIERATNLHPGAEYSIEVVSFNSEHHVVGITQKWTTANFVEAGQLFPSESFPADLKTPLEAAIYSLLESLKVCYCVSHWEFIVTQDRRIALVEGHLRPAGDRILDLVQISTGTSATGALCRALATQKSDFTFIAGTTCGIFWMVPQYPLSEVTGVTFEAVAKEHPGAQLYLDFKRIQDISNWTGAMNSMTRLAHVIAAGTDAESVLAICRTVASCVILHGMNGNVCTSTPLMLTIDRQEELESQLPCR
jgi:hypothetical protein